MGLRTTLRHLIMGGQTPPTPSSPAFSSPGSSQGRSEASAPTPRVTPAPPPPEPTDDEVKAQIEKHLQAARLVIFMKGTADAPRCGFSASAGEMAVNLGVPFHTVDVTTEPGMREGVKAFTQWPTIPQVFVDGKFVGGSDIMKEMYESGDLRQMLK